MGELLVARGESVAIFKYGGGARVAVVVESGLVDGGTVECRFLRQIAYTQVVAEHYVAAVGVFHTGKYAQQCGLTCAVAGHDTDFVALFYTESKVAEEKAVAIALGEVLYIEDISHKKSKLRPWTAHIPLYGSYEESASDNITDGSGQQVDYKEGIEVYRRSLHHGQRYEKHICHAVLESESHESEDRNLACEQFLAQTSAAQSEPYCKTYTPVGAYALEQHRTEAHRSLCCRQFGYSLGVGACGECAGQIYQEISHRQCPDEVEAPYCCPVGYHIACREFALEKRRHQQGVVAREKVGTEHYHEHEPDGENEPGEQLLKARILGGYTRKTGAYGKRQSTAQSDVGACKNTT